MSQLDAMPPHIAELIKAILALPRVDDAITLSLEGGIKLLDGRWLVPVNVYLRDGAPDGETLGINVTETVGTVDKFGG